MITPARALLLLLLPSLGVAACGDDGSTPTGSTTPGGGTSGAGGSAGSTAGSGGSDVGGAAGLGGAAGASGGAAGSSDKPACSGGTTPSGETTICYGADGKSDTISRSQFEGGDFQVDCPNLQRAPGSACPTGVAPCGYGGCGTFGKPYGAPTLTEDRCCFPMQMCRGPNACGRPLIVDAAPLVARLVSSSSWV